jgi:hypothetical protein
MTVPEAFADWPDIPESMPPSIFAAQAESEIAAADVSIRARVKDFVIESSV